MKQVGRIVVLTISLLMVRMGVASAVPVIDGTLGAGEWDGFFLSGGDPNEVAIPDSYDLSGMRMIQESSGGGSDGVYVLLTTYAAPSLVDTGVGPPPALIAWDLDVNGDLDFSDAGDRFSTHTLASGFDVFSGTGTLLLDGVSGTHYALGSVIEYFIPASVLGVPLPGTISSFAIYDNGGDAPDDRMPNTGFFTPIPEPSSMILLGLGLLGGVGGRRKWLLGV